MKIPEGRQIVSSHADAKLHERVRVMSVKTKKAMPAILDEALKLWLAEAKNGE